MAKRHRNPATHPCPCGTGQPYPHCCGKLHRGQADAATAEALMRSRYSAYAIGDTAYLLRSWHTSTRPTHLHPEPGQRWTRLDILHTERGGLLDTTGTVTFQAHYRQAGRPETLTEHSRFTRENGRWVYLDAQPRLNRTTPADANSPHLTGRHHPRPAEE